MSKNYEKLSAEELELEIDSIYSSLSNYKNTETNTNSLLFAILALFCLHSNSKIEEWATLPLTILISSIAVLFFILFILGLVPLDFTKRDFSFQMKNGVKGPVSPFRSFLRSLTRESLTIVILKGAMVLLQISTLVLLRTSLKKVPEFFEVLIAMMTLVKFIPLKNVTTILLGIVRAVYTVATAQASFEQSKIMKAEGKEKEANTAQGAAICLIMVNFELFVALYCMYMREGHKNVRNYLFHLLQEKENQDKSSHIQFKQKEEQEMEMEFEEMENPNSENHRLKIKTSNKIEWNDDDNPFDEKSTQKLGLKEENSSGEQSKPMESIKTVPQMGVSHILKTKQDASTSTSDRIILGFRHLQTNEMPGQMTSKIRASVKSSYQNSQSKKDYSYLDSKSVHFRNSSWAELEKRAQGNEILAAELDFSKARVLDEFMTLNDDWVLMLDSHLRIVSNNFTQKIWAKVIHQMEHRMNMECSYEEGLPMTVYPLFDRNNSQTMMCCEKTGLTLYEIAMKVCEEDEKIQRKNLNEVELDEIKTDFVNIQLMLQNIDKLKNEIWNSVKLYGKKVVKSYGNIPEQNLEAEQSKHERKEDLFVI